MLCNIMMNEMKIKNIYTDDDILLYAIWKPRMVLWGISIFGLEDYMSVFDTDGFLL